MNESVWESLITQLRSDNENLEARTHVTPMPTVVGGNHQATRSMTADGLVGLTCLGAGMPKKVTHHGLQNSAYKYGW